MSRQVIKRYEMETNGSINGREPLGQVIGKTELLNDNPQ
jgi:hypothetical protein